MKHLSFSLLALLLGLLTCRPIQAQDLLNRNHVRASLLTEAPEIHPGEPFTVGVLLEMESGWHTYWQFGGDSGAPTRITWQLPAGFQAGPTQWPLPHARPDEGDQLTYVYENQVLLLVEITPPAQLPAAPVELSAKLRWLACKETCIPGEATVSVGFPNPSAQPALFTQWRAQLPKSTPPPFGLNWKSTGPKELQLLVQTVPAEVKLEFFPIPEGEVQPGHPKVNPPTSTGERLIEVPLTGEGALSRGVLAVQNADGTREGWLIQANGTAAPVTAQPATELPVPASMAAPELPQSPKLLAVLWGAFLGGMLLNLMPCVLPVIALKIFGFVQQAGKAPKRVFRLGLAFVAGVFCFFLGLAALVVSFQNAGGGLTWGFQFQNVSILATLICLVFLFALAMFGIFEITLNSQAATTLDQMSRRDGYAGAFVHGLFTTLLGTSCTAPLLGPVLGFAFVQPAHVVFLVFTVIAAGMSLPYFLLTWQPAWMRFLPKPGAWMERMKQFMGFVLLGVAIWLLGVLGRSHGVDAMSAVSQFLLVMGLAAWIYGVGRNLFALLIALALLGGGWKFILRDELKTRPKNTAELQTSPNGIPWQPFSPERLTQAVQSGQPVFIDFTADWCLNCKYNERVVLETEPVRAVLRDKKVLALKADWTNGDPAITTMLKQFGRVGVPAYVLYPGQGVSQPVVLPEILSQTLLLNALAEIKP